MVSMYGFILNNIKKITSVVLHSPCLTCFSVLNYSERWTENCFGLIFFPITNAGAHSCLLLLPCSFALSPTPVSHRHTCTHTHTKLCCIASCCLSCNRILPALNLVLEWIWAWSVVFSVFKYEVIYALQFDHIKSAGEWKHN